jgi:proline iminopeptidase
VIPSSPVAGTEQQSALYPPLEPYRIERLAVDALHSLHVEQCGNREGFPVLFLHGGPGSHIRPHQRQYFDPAFYRIVLFDQRGCGQSLPAGCTEQNTTWHLVADIERLRIHLGVQRWLLFGGSWGATLALAYAETHPERVAGLVLRGVFLGTETEIRWYVDGLRRFVPCARRLLTATAECSEGLLARYHALVNHPDMQTHTRAAQAWVGYEEAVMRLGSGSAPMPSASGAADALHRARIQLHFLANGCFLRDNELLERAWRVGDVPAILVQGRLDMVCPPLAAAELARRLPNAELRMVENGGHSALDPLIAGALRRATDDMRGRVRR